MSEGIGDDCPYNIQCGVHSVRGVRPEMEDKHVVIPLKGVDVVSTDGTAVKSVTVPRVGYYAVFDGHGGDEAAALAAQKLHVYIAGSEHFKHRRHRDAILEGFEKLEAETAASVAKAGTTALVALFTDALLWVANVGDTEAVLCRAGEPIRLSIVHNASKNPAEGERVLAAGGKLAKGRVQHPVWAVLTTAVSRAIGNCALKQGENTDGHPTGLIATPDIKDLRLTRDDEFLLLACDGLWEAFDHKTAVDFIRERLAGGADVDATCQSLVEAALERGSSDNVTAMLLRFIFPAEGPTAPAAS